MNSGEPVQGPSWRTHQPLTPPNTPPEDDGRRPSITTTEIEDAIVSILSDLTTGQTPTLSTGDSPSQFTSLPTNERLCRLVLLMAKVHELVTFGRYSTIRDLYYENTEVFGSQANLVQLINTLCRLLKVPREALNLEASAKGLIAGDLTFVSSAGEVNVSQYPGGMLIPSKIKAFTEFRTQARFVLIVEKDAVFQKLLEETCFDPVDGFGPAILVTGKGYPDMASRELLSLFASKLALPIFILVDSNPYGAEIAMVIKWGSIGQARLSRSTGVDVSRYTVPDLIWIGLHSEEIESLNLSEHGVPMTQRDTRKVQILQDRVAKKGDREWVERLSQMERCGLKVEIEAVSAQGRGFLTRMIISRIRTIRPDLFP